MNPQLPMWRAGDMPPSTTGPSIDLHQQFQRDIQSKQLFLQILSTAAIVGTFVMAVMAFRRKK